ncbi:MAG: aminopeptidase P family protein [Candidatus Latescibacteria bacterium]|jgi:Xaa-Pro aminopeptidase|nr:aminopeptidase P family protein [Candidatus Latescibacterota bacterium]
MSDTPFVLAGVPAGNPVLYHRIQFLVGDSAVYIGLPGGDSVLFVRDIEMDRARKIARADRIVCASDFPPEGGLSGDRDTAIAQATGEFLRCEGIKHVKTDRSLPFIYAHHIYQAGVTIEYDLELGVRQRRMKEDYEIEYLRECQAFTGTVMRAACERVADATVSADGSLSHAGKPLTSEGMRRWITALCLEHGYSTPHDSIVVTIPHVAVCHRRGEGPLRTSAPVIIDIFPRNDETRYWGDCTRTVVHGDMPEEVVKMHTAVCEAKTTGVAALKPGVTGEAVHADVVKVLLDRGFRFKRGSSDPNLATPAMRHGTGHGIGLDVHEPILLDEGADTILERETFTVEPGLYSTVHGGVRVEDMVLATPSGGEILGGLYEGLDWRS